MTPRWRWPVTLAAAMLTAACSTTGSVSERTGGGHRHTTPARQRSTAAGGEYVVQRGDTLYSIAFRNQLDFHDLANWNGIGRDYTIYPGKVLRLTPPDDLSLPPAGRTAPPAASGSPAVAAAPASAVARAPAPAWTPPPARQPPPEMPVNSAPPPVLVPSPAPADSAGPNGPDFDAGRWEWPTRGKVVRGFSSDSSKGIDISGDIGQIVVAAAAGKVVYSGSALKGYGELVIIKHDERYLSAYGYNRRRLVEEGQQVLAGQPIAELGEGPEQRPLLHFEIRDKGKPVDPLPLLPRR